MRMSAPSFSVGRKRSSPVAVGRPVPPPPSFDDSELRRRLRELEGRVIPQFDPSALQAQIGGLQQQLGNIPQFDPSNLQSQIGGLQDRLANIPQFDPSGLQEQIGGLQDRLANIPQFDPSGLQEQIGGLQQQLGDIPQFDPSGLQEQIGGLEDRLANIPQFDPSGLQDRLKALEGKETPTFDPSQLQQGIAGLEDRLANIPQFDPSALQNRLSELENRQAPTFNPDDFREQFLNIAREGIDIPQPTQAFDPSGLQNRLQALENREMPQFDPSRLQERLSALENVQPVAPTPAFDPSSLQARLDALENREPVAAPPAFDPSGLMARLDDFESRLGALQQPLPIQPPGDLDLGIKEDAPDIRDFAKPLPEGGTIFDELPEPTPPQPPQNVVGRPTPPVDSLERIGSGTYKEFVDPETGNVRSVGVRDPIIGLNPPPSVPIQGPPLRGSEIIPGGRPTPPMSIGGPGGGTYKEFPTPGGGFLSVGVRPPSLKPIGGITGGKSEELINPNPIQIPSGTGSPSGGFGFPTRDMPEPPGGFPNLPPQPLKDNRLPGEGLPPIPVAGTGTNFRPTPPISIGGPSGGRDDLVFSGGSPTFNERGETFVPPRGEFVTTGPASDLIGRSQDVVTTGPDNIGGGAPSLVDQQQDLTTGDEMQTPTLANEQPFAAGVTQVATGLDPLTEQLLFGIGGQGGFIPGAMRAAEKVFYDDQGNPVVIDEQVAGFSPDQLQAMQMQREALGMQDPYLQGAGQAFGAGTQALEEGLQRGRTAAVGALEATKGGVGSLQEGLGESADILRGTLGGYDPSMTDRFYDPFEDRVVQQTIEDIMEQGAKSDIGARASDIARGGESAFGSRARLGAGERQEALGRGLAEALGGIRSRGFREAQQTGLGEFARQKAAERAASTGLASLAGQGFGGSQALAGALSGLGQTEQDIGQQRYSGQFGLGTSLQGLGAQAAGASASDIAALYGMGSQQQGQAQAMLDAQRRNLQQRQMTPLLQYQSLAPFISMAPAGQFTTTTQFAPPPSPMQAGLGVGLSAFGALGQLYGGGK